MKRLLILAVAALTLLVGVSPAQIVGTYSNPYAGYYVPVDATTGVTPFYAVTFNSTGNAVVNTAASAVTGFFGCADNTLSGANIKTGSVLVHQHGPAYCTVDSGGATDGDYFTYSATAGMVKDQGITTPNLQSLGKFTATAASGSVSTMLGRPALWDFPSLYEEAAGICAGSGGATAGSGWNLPTSAAFTAACLTQSNTQLGVLTAAQSTSAQLLPIHIPKDWDSASSIYASIDFDQGNYSTASSTVVLSIAIACSATPISNPAFATAQAFGTATTGTTAYQVYSETVTLNSTSLTNCAAGGLMYVKISRGSGDTGAVTPDIIDANITIPRTAIIQAN